MYQVSPTYNPYCVDRHVTIEYQLRIVDENAAGNATCSATYPNSCSSVQTLASDGLTSMGGRFFTLEPDYLACDKIYDIMPDDYHRGCWGGSIDDQQEISFVFSSPVTSLGLSLWFDEDAGEWPYRVSVQFHSSVSTIAADGEDTPDDPPVDVFPERSFAILLFPDAEPVTYSGITLTITPHNGRRVRLAGVSFGITQQYNNETIKSWDWDEEADIYASCIPALTEKAEVIADNGQFSITDPELIDCIHPGLRIKTTVIVDGERIPMKDTILRDIQDSGNGITATITSVDNVYFFDTVAFKTKSDSANEMWDSADGFTAKALENTSALQWVLIDGVRQRIQHSIPTTVSAIKFNPHREVNTVRYWMPTIAQAIRCHIMQDRDGVVVFKGDHNADKAEPGYCDIISKSNATKITKEILQRVNRVDVVSAIEDEEEEGLYQYVAEISSMYSGETENEEKYSNSLLTHAIGQDCAKWLLQQHNRRIKFKAEWRGNPALDLLDSVSVDGNPAIITGLHFSFNGYFRGSVEAYCGLYDILQRTEITTRREHEWNP